MQDGLISRIIFIDGLDVQCLSCYGPMTERDIEGSSSNITYAFATRGF